MLDAAPPAMTQESHSPKNAKCLLVSRQTLMAGRCLLVVLALLGAAPARGFAAGMTRTLRTGIVMRSSAPEPRGLAPKLPFSSRIMVPSANEKGDAADLVIGALSFMPLRLGARFQPINPLLEFMRTSHIFHPLAPCRHSNGYFRLDACTFVDAFDDAALCAHRVGK